MSYNQRLIRDFYTILQLSIDKSIIQVYNDNQDDILHLYNGGESLKNIHDLIQQKGRRKPSRLKAAEKM